MIKKFLHYINIGIWHIQIHKLPKWKALWVRFMRIILITIQGFTKSQIQQGASSLTYYTLLALVPVLALLIGIARGFRLEKPLEEGLIREFSEQKEVIAKIFEFANTSLSQVNQGLIAGIGVALLFWTAIKILLNIEYVMNQIWEVRAGRSFADRFSDYLALIVLTPLIIFVSSGINLYLSAVFAFFAKGETLKEIGTVVIPLLQLIPFLLSCFLWTFVYIFMPNTKVNFLPALIAGIFTAIVYQLVQWIYFYLQVGVSKYNAVYGTFAALPLFLIWLHLSWTIILLGAKVAFALQNMDAYEFISEKIGLSHKSREICALRITHYCIKKFMKGAAPPSVIETSNNLSIPHSIARHLLFILVGAGVLSEVVRSDGEAGFQPARSPETLTIKMVLDMINVRGREVHLPRSHELSAILDCLQKFSTAIEKSPGNRLLKDI